MKLAKEPAFWADPATVMGRAVAWSAAVALHKSPVFRLTPAGERLRVPSDLRYTSVTAFLLRDWVEPELRMLDSLLAPGDTFIDVGANVGLYTLKAARIVGPEGVVLALEPGREARALLQENLALNAFPWVRVIPMAASSEDGQALLHHVELGDDPQAFSLLENMSAHGKSEPVETTRLDTLIRREEIERIDLIKIDVEGAEPLVLEGAQATLAALKPKVIFECNAYPKTRLAGLKAWRLLSDLGYRFQRHSNQRFIPISQPPSDFCNVLAVAGS